MLLPCEYTTVDRSASDELVERKSRFIGYACPVSTVQAAEDFIKSVKRRHNDARHNCYAYSLLSGEMRYSDDGEPQGTAGQPILDVLNRGGIFDCVIVVTRYFGGILLGTGGLTRAYTAAAQIAVKAAGVVNMARMMRCRLSLDYTLYGIVQTLIAKYNAVQDNSDFAETVQLEILINEADFDGFSSDLAEISAGKIKLVPDSTEYIKKSAQK